MYDRKIYCLQVCECVTLFSPVDLTGWGSEGVKMGGQDCDICGLCADWKLCLHGVLPREDNALGTGLEFWQVRQLSGTAMQVYGMHTVVLAAAQQRLKENLAF